MSYSKTVYLGQTGAQTDYPVSFGFISRSHVSATVDGVDAPFTWLNDGMIRMNLAPTGDLIISRTTPNAAPIVSFVDGSTHSGEKHQTQNLQLLYVAQEIYDRVEDTIFTDGVDYDAEGKRLINLADPVDDQDAVSKLWVEAAMQSTLVQAEDARDGAEAAKLDSEAAASEAQGYRDEVFDEIPLKLSQYGSVEDGITSDSAALASASAATNPYKIPVEFEGNIAIDDLYWHLLSDANIKSQGVGHLITSEGKNGPQEMYRIDAKPDADWALNVVSAFNYEQVVPNRRGLVVTGATTLGDEPNGINSGGSQTWYGGVETSLTHDVVMLKDTGSNGGSGAPARTGYTMHRPMLFQHGKGDASVIRPYCKVTRDAGDPIEPKAQDRPTVEPYGGATVAGSDFVKLAYGEYHIRDNGYDVRGVGPNFVFSRDNDDELNESSWECIRVRSKGSKAPNVGMYFSSAESEGGFKHGIDFSGTHLTQGSAMSMREDQFIDFNSTEKKWPVSGIYHEPILGGWQVGYDSTAQAMQIRSPTQAMLEASDTQVILGGLGDSATKVRIPSADHLNETRIGTVGRTGYFSVTGDVGDYTKMAFRLFDSANLNVVAELTSDGAIDMQGVNPGVKVDGTRVLGTQQAKVDRCSNNTGGSGGLNLQFISDTNTANAITRLNNRINALIDVLEAHGLSSDV